MGKGLKFIPPFETLEQKNSHYCGDYAQAKAYGYDDYSDRCSRTHGDHPSYSIYLIWYHDSTKWSCFICYLFY